MQTLRRWLRPPRKLRFTRQGKWFTAMTLMVGFGAINTGNNLLYLLLGMMLGLIVVSGLASETMLRWLRAQRLTAGPVFAGAPAPIEYRLVNGKRLFPSFSIEISEVEDAATRRLRRGEGRPGRRAKRKDPGVPRCLVHHVAAGTAIARSGSVTLPRRGLYRYERIEVATRFPFGFFEKSRWFEDPSELLALPRPVDPPGTRAPDHRNRGVLEHPRAGRGLEYLGLRDYQAGEDWRRIHWKTTARRGEPVVRETQKEARQALDIAVYSVVRPDAAATVGDDVEHLIERAAGLARAYLDQGYAVGLLTPRGALPQGRGEAQLGRILRALALLEVNASETALALSKGACEAVFLVALSEGSPPLPPGPYDAILKVERGGEARWQ